MRVYNCSYRKPEVSHDTVELEAIPADSDSCGASARQDASNTLAGTP
jgi:hypothetical protein